MDRRSIGAGLVGLFLLGSPGPVRAEGDEEKPAASALETRVYAVGALLRGTTAHRADYGPYGVRSDMVNDEANPLFGGEEEEPRKELTSGELVDLVRASVAGGDAWEREGTSLSPMGEKFLIARAARAEQDGIAEFLAAEARRLRATVVVDVAVLEGDAAALRGGGTLAEAAAGRQMRVLAFARALVPPGGRSVARDGTQRALLTDVDVEVAEDARVSDPIVGVVPDGIALEAEALAVSPGRATVRVRGWRSAPPTITTYRTKEGDVLELAATDGRAFDATLDLEDGAWGVSPLAAGVVLAVRARVSAPEVTREEMAGDWVAGLPPGTPVGALARREFDLSPLTESVANGRGPRLAVWPSNYTPPAPPELPEPAPLFPSDTLAELIKSSVDPASWDQEGASLDVRRGRLYVRNDATRLDAVQRAIDGVRASCARTNRVRVSVVSLPAAALPELWTGLDDTLVADGGDGLLRRGGARMLDTLGLRLRDGQRLATVSGSLRGYMADFDVEIACKAVIANPVIRDVLAGTSLDVAAAPIGGGGHLALDLRLERGVVREMRTATSAHGPIQCPVYDVLRCLGSLTLKSGSTRIAGASLSSADVTLVLVTATRE